MTKHVLPGIAHWILTKILKYRDITKDVDGVETVYLRRYFFIGYDSWLVKKLKFPKVFIHNIRRSDDDRDPHDHPWDFTTIILTKGYQEENYEVGPDLAKFIGIGIVKPLRIYSRPASYTHRVLTHRGPMWTIVFPTGRKKPWGFWTKNGWVEWRDYLGMLEAPESPEDA